MQKIYKIHVDADDLNEEVLDRIMDSAMDFLMEEVVHLVGDVASVSVDGEVL